MTVDLWIQDHSIVTIGANRLKINAGEGLEDLSHGSVTWNGQVGHRAAPWWGRLMWHVVHWPPCHVHLPALSIFFTILHNFCYNSCIQINLHVQVELGEL